MSDYIVRATAAASQIRAFEVVQWPLFNEPRYFRLCSGLLRFCHTGSLLLFHVVWYKGPRYLHLHQFFSSFDVSIMHFVATIFSLLFFNYNAKTLKNFNLEHSYSLYIEKTRLFIWIIIVMLHLVSCISLAFMVVSAISYF